MLRYGWVNSYIHAERRTAENAIAAESAARRAESATERLEDQLERQALLIQSLLELCARKNLISEQELREVVNEIDLSDGRLDGKLRPRPGPRSCPDCGKVNGRHAVTCMYCSAQLPDPKLL